ncbi:hypothetical protein FHR49_000269 [Xanthomonas campestris]
MPTWSVYGKRGYSASRAHVAQAVSCEDIVENGLTPEYLAVMKQALTARMGQREVRAAADWW